jgi:hypothetical protein
MHPCVFVWVGEGRSMCGLKQKVWARKCGGVEECSSKCAEGEVQGLAWAQWRKGSANSSEKACQFAGDCCGLLRNPFIMQTLCMCGRVKDVQESGREGVDTAQP